jgi:hypothetical protein
MSQILWVKNGVEVRVDDSICGQTCPPIGRDATFKAGQPRTQGGDPILSGTGDSVTLSSQIFGQILFHLSRCLERHRI